MRKPNRYLFLGAIVLTLALSSWGYPIRSRFGLAEADYKMISISAHYPLFTSAWWQKNESRVTDWTKREINWKSEANKSTWEATKSQLGRRHNTAALLDIYCPSQPFSPSISSYISKRFDYGATDPWIAGASGVVFDCPTGTEPVTMPTQLSLGKQYALWQILDQLPSKPSPFQVRILLLALWNAQSLTAEHKKVFELLFAHGFRDVFLETAYFDVCQLSYVKDRANELKRLQLVEQAQLLFQRYPGYLSSYRVLIAGSMRVRAHRDQGALDYYLEQQRTLSSRLLEGDSMDREAKIVADRTLEWWNTVLRREIFGADARPTKL